MDKGDEQPKQIHSEGDRITFGKYKGKLIKDTIKKDPSYIKWAIKQGLLKLPKFLKL